MKDICARCRFWEFISRPEFDYAKGECRRHAPAPIPRIISMIAEFASDAGWASMTAAHVEIDEAPYQERGGTGVYEIHEWPITSASDWCGDFDQRQELAEVNARHPLVHARFAAANEFERVTGLDNSGPWVGKKFKATKESDQ